MAIDSFAVRLEVPWKEPLGLDEPTAEQWSGGVVVVMTTCMSGGTQGFQTNEVYLMDPDAADRLIDAGFARYETEREERIAKSEGHKRPSKGVKRPDTPNKKSKGKAKDAPEGG